MAFFKQCILLLLLVITCVSCEEERLNAITDLPPREFKSDKVIIVVWDGVRYSESYGSPTKSELYVFGKFAEGGVVLPYFYNSEHSWTLSGMTAITTGFYQLIQNDGDEYPQNPSIFQYFLSEKQLPPTKTLLISNKGKSKVLADCMRLEWRGKYLPASAISGDWDDIDVHEESLRALQTEKPEVMIIHFKGPDKYGHGNDWEKYLASIKEIDGYLEDLMSILDKDDFYKGQTTVMVTNDHGRHLDGLNTGFIGHGDSCPGCKQIMFVANGPDLKKGTEIGTSKQLIDVAPTAAYILGLSSFKAEGKVMTEIFEE